MDTGAKVAFLLPLERKAFQAVWLAMITRRTAITQGDDRLSQSVTLSQLPPRVCVGAHSSATVFRHVCVRVGVDRLGGELSHLFVRMSIRWMLTMQGGKCHCSSLGNLWIFSFSGSTIDTQLRDAGEYRYPSCESLAVVGKSSILLILAERRSSDPSHFDKYLGSPGQGSHAHAPNIVLDADFAQVRATLPIVIPGTEDGMSTDATSH